MLKATEGTSAECSEPEKMRVCGVRMHTDVGMMEYNVIVGNAQGLILVLHRGKEVADTV